MRRLAYVSAACAVLAVPVVASAATRAAGDGSLVVRHGAAPWNVTGQADVPVVALKITGSVIGRVDGYGKIVIDPGADSDAVATVTGAGRPRESTQSDTASVWKANDFTFRAVNGTFTILVYGSDVNLVAAGKGGVRLAGDPDAPRHDGTYSLNDGDFHSLPNVQSARLVFGTNG